MIAPKQGLSSFFIGRKESRDPFPKEGQPKGRTQEESCEATFPRQTHSTVEESGEESAKGYLADTFPRSAVKPANSGAPK